MVLSHGSDQAEGLRRVLARHAQAGVMQTLVVIGAPGIGKTSCVINIGAELDAQGLPLRCIDSERAGDGPDDAETLLVLSPGIDAITRARVTLAVGLNRRFHPNMIELARRARDGTLGTIGTINAELTAATGFHRPGTSWRVNATEEPAGAMVSIGVHLVDAMMHIAGRVREVVCVAANRGGPHGDDTTHLMLQFDSGVTGLIYCSVAAARNHRIAVYGTKGFAEVLKPQMDTFRFIPVVEGHASHLARIPEPEVIEVPGFNYVGQSLKTFAHCIRDGLPYPISTTDILHGVAVLEAAIRSAATKKPVQVTD